MNVDRAYMRAHAGFAALALEDHRVIPQGGVTQYIFPEGDRRNALWDYFVTTDKRHFFSSCAEGNFAEGCSLYEYFPQSNTVKKIFDFDDTITHAPGAIRASKIHTSLCEMEDGRLIFQTHTTAAAPGHPMWMPYGYRSHMWEGFPGSNILIYDPKANRVEDLGIPVPHESLYGGVYSARNRAMYSSALMNGHIYRFDLDTRHVTDYGNLTESACCCMKEGPDGHIYFASDNGDLMRIRTDTLAFEDLGLRFQVDTRYKCQNDMQMMYAVNGPDGKIYIAPRGCELLQAFDPETGRLETVGSVMPAALARYPHYGMIYGMDFDEDGVLWYGLMTHPKPGTYPDGEIAFFLCSWDLIRGGSPIHYGLMGTPRRRVLVFSEAHITDGLFIGGDTNHWFDPIGLFCVDLKKLRAEYAEGIRGPLTQDAGHYTRFEDGADVYPGDLARDAAPLYQRLEEEAALVERYGPMADRWRFTGYREGYVWKPWRVLEFEDATVAGIIAEQDGACRVLCGKGPLYTAFILREGDVVQRMERVPWQAPGLPGSLTGAPLPAAAGRQWIACASCAVPWHDGRWLMGTQDGLVALVGEEGTYALGGVGVCGPIRALCVTGDQRMAYGIAGAAQDIGMLFCYDDRQGLRQLGAVFLRDPRPGCGESCLLGSPSAIAVSQDGSRLYIGSDDVKSAVVELLL